MADKKPKMISMKRTESDRRKGMGEPAEVEYVAPDYPYGLCMSLEGDELDKLGMKELPQVGTVMPMTVLVKVTGVNQSASEMRNGEADESRRVTLQITDMAIG